MEPRIGFSTGALAFSDYRAGLHMLSARHISVVELSSLRDRELRPLVGAINGLPLQSFSYVSFHAPSTFSSLSESEVTDLLKEILPRQWPIIVHPDVILNPGLWRELGEWLCIENMDKRKPIGRTSVELERVFQDLPEASFCFDIGHARQVDPTMSEAALLLRRFGNRLKQVHMSEVNSSSKHEPMSFTAVSAFRRIAPMIPLNVPIILESVVPENRIEHEIEIATSIMNQANVANVAFEHDNHNSGGSSSKSLIHSR